MSMSAVKAYAMVGQQVSGRWTAGFTTGDTPSTIQEVFASESQARAWIASQASRLGLQMDEVVWVDNQRSKAD